MRPLCDGREADIDEDRGGVTVPPELARPLAAAARLGLAVFDRRNGGGASVVPGLEQLLGRLAASAGFPGETPPAVLGSPSWLRTGEAAELTGTSVQWVRGLARSGKIRGRLNAGRWEIDRQAAEDYGRERRCRNR